MYDGEYKNDNKFDLVELLYHPTYEWNLMAELTILKSLQTLTSDTWGLEYIGLFTGDKLTTKNLKHEITADFVGNRGRNL